MIKVNFKRQASKLVSFTVSGHAGFDEYNRDIVCSAVSALTITVINGLTEVLKVKADYSVDEGFTELNLSELDEPDIDKCQVLMETLLLGIKSMEFQYGKYIILKMEEV
jgi:uncharacterized protein YsxB (DUF464 family)